MLDIKYIRENQKEVEKNCQLRKIKCDVSELLRLDEKRRGLLQKVEELNGEKNKLNEEIGQAPEEKKKEIAKKGKGIKEKLSELEPELKKVEKKYWVVMDKVPNITHPDSPIGKDDTENKEIERYGKNPRFDFKPKTHVEIMEKLDMIDFKRATKVSGSKFYYLKNEGALLELALINYAFEKILEKGFTPFITPDLAKDEVLQGIGFNPRGRETQVYSIENMPLSLVGTAEITMGGYHQKETIKEVDLPKKYVALSHCFRTEAGSYGRHSSGLYRVHQFSKVEMFAYCIPEKSGEMHQLLKETEVDVFEGLKIPFRVVDICTGDLGGPAQRKYDLEAFMTSKLPEKYEHEQGEVPEEILKNSWGEITSTSNCTDYQSRRLGIRVEREDGKKELLHMLNGTVIATSRALIAVVENYQQEDGSVLIPEVLQKYMPGGMEKIEPKK